MSSLRIGLVQLTSTDNFANNLKNVLNAMDRACALGELDLLSFPENTLFMRLGKDSVIPNYGLNEAPWADLQKKVDECNFDVVLTTPLVENGNMHNCTVLFQSGKEPRILYRKIHLFDVDVPGAPPVRESDFFKSGEKPFLWDYKGWKIGLTICYDLRFSELFLYYAKLGAEAVMVPSAFLVPTGEAHWHTLLRARAIEGQSYILAPAQGGEHSQVRKTYGHSLAVDPWGRILVDMDNQGVSIVELKKDEVERVRMQIPMHQHRRL